MDQTRGQVNQATDSHNPWTKQRGQVNAVLRYAVVALGVAGIIFGAHLTALAFAVGEAYAASLRRCAHVLALSLKAVCAAATGVNWFAAAGE